MMVQAQIEWNRTIKTAGEDSLGQALSKCGYWRLVSSPCVTDGHGHGYRWSIERKWKIYHPDRAEWEWFIYPIDGIYYFHTLKDAKRALGGG